MIDRMDHQSCEGLDRRSLLLGGGALAAATVAGLAAAAPAAAAPTVPAGLGFTPMTPYRSYDSRFDPFGKITAGEYFPIQVITDQNGEEQVPTTAQAVTFNLTITQTGTPGYLGVVPAGTPETGFTVSNINWVSAGIDLANGGTTKIASDPESGDGSVIVYCGGDPLADPLASTHFIIDVTGFFSP